MKEKLFEVEEIKDKYIRKVTVTNVVDGDTFDGIVDLGYHVTTVQRFRLLYVNTPEKGCEGAKEATEFTKKTILGRTLYVGSEKDDAFGRWLAVVYMPLGEYENSKTLNALLLENNLAVHYSRKR